MPRHPAPPDLDATAARLCDRVRLLAGDRLTDGASLAAAVSGGADSLALLLLAHRAFGSRIVVLAVDHGLRPEAAAECAHVECLAQSLGLPAHVLRATLEPGDGLQARARAARYRLMGTWCAAHGVPVLLTAHHADDQAETLLMRAARGSGLSGLAGIRARVDLKTVRVVRPLLDRSRATLAAIVRAAGWQPADDPSNRDPRFDRTHARRLLADTDWLDPRRLAASASHLAEAEEGLRWAADAAWRSRAQVGDARVRIDSSGLPPELERRLLERTFDSFGLSAPEGPAIARLLRRLRAGRGGTLAGLRARVLPSGDWQIDPAPPRRGRSH